MGSAAILVAFGVWTAVGSAAPGAAKWAKQEPVPNNRIVHIRVLAFTTFSPDQLKVLTTQMEAIWNAHEIPLRWTCPTDEDCLRVVLVDQVRVRDAGRRPRIECLGSIPFVNGRPVRTLYVALNRIRDLVRDAQPSTRPDALRELLVARVAGRAAAHELAHYLLVTTAHARTGLLRSAFSAQDLVGASLEPFLLTEQQRESLDRRPRMEFQEILPLEHAARRPKMQRRLLLEPQAR